MRIDFTNPFQVRRWLKCLDLDEEAGYRLKPNLLKSKRCLGFSLDSNQYGLRGPSLSTSPNVILGTSYAMGFGVDVGRNWYDLNVDFRNWFNAGLPVGPEEWNYLLRRYYTGCRKNLLFLYHPNIIQHGLSFLKWRKTNKNVFEYFRWRTSRLACAKLYLRNAVLSRRRIRDGELVFLKNGTKRYRLNGKYSFVSEKNLVLLPEVFVKLREVLESFDRVTIVRVQVKEEQVPERDCSSILLQTLQQYKLFWKMFKQEISTLKSADILEVPRFGLDFFNPYDTHWNEGGNFKFNKYLMSENLDRM